MNDRSAPKKRLALFLDGTWNTVESATNVSKLHDNVAARGGGIEQLAYYDPGVGTGRFQWLRGGALGYGLSDNVVQAYHWLKDHYQNGDEIYIFGFSRGAYTARSLAGLIAKCGLLRSTAAIDAETLFARYQRSAEMRPIYTLAYEADHGGRLTDEEAALLEASRRVPIMMIAVWDTVGSLGIPFGNIPGLSRRRFRFHHTRLSNLFAHAYHALAIDEHRAPFAPSLWTRFSPKVPTPPSPGPQSTPIVEQRWFIGAHADVGGGNPTHLPSAPMHWIAQKAEQAGLAFDPLPPIGASDYLAPITDSYHGFMFGIYRRLKARFYRTIGASRVEKRKGFVDTVNETIDASVFRRLREDPGYRPQALANWAQRRGVVLDRCEGDCDAATGNPLTR